MHASTSSRTGCARICLCVDPFPRVIRRTLTIRREPICTSAEAMDELEGIAESQERAIGEALMARSIAIDYYQVLMHARFRSRPVVA